MILKCVAAPAAEAKLGTLFLNSIDTKITRHALEGLGHPQLATPIHVDNTTTVGMYSEYHHQATAFSSDAHATTVCLSCYGVVIFMYPESILDRHTDG